MSQLNEPKSKLTASIRRRLLELLDKRAGQLNLNRSQSVEKAIELWLRVQNDREEESYFSSAAEGMNADARSWNATTSSRSRR